MAYCLTFLLSDELQAGGKLSLHALQLKWSSVFAANASIAKVFAHTQWQEGRREERESKIGRREKGGSEAEGQTDLAAHSR